MIWLFYFFAACLVVLSLRSFLGGIRYLRFFREELAKPLSPYLPFVSVVTPCRGLEAGLAENLSAVLKQDYPDFEIIFVVDSERDPAAEVISSLIKNRHSESPHCKLIVASKAVTSSQKIENLLEGIRHTNEHSEVFVFVDSDARPSSNWLRSLVSRLDDPSVGVATGYRWFISHERSFASELLSVWNASIASALGPKSSFCWGGSSAIRRQLFERLDIAKKWGGAVSDDFVLANAIKQAGLDIAFVPQALTASFQSIGLDDVFEFTNRQMKLTRVYSMPLWLVTLVGNAIFTIVMVSAFLISIVKPMTDAAMWASVATFVTVSFLSIGKSYERWKALRLVLPQYANELQKQFWPQHTLWLLSSPLFFVNSVIALLSRRITWRGITYELKSPSETVIIAPK
jgi:ceramide glucosyltransferase